MRPLARPAVPATCGAATSTASGSTESPQSSLQRRSRSSARRRTAGSSANGPSSAPRSGRSPTLAFSSCPRPRPRTPRFPIRSGCAGSRPYASGSSRSIGLQCARSSWTRRTESCSSSSPTRSARPGGGSIKGESSKQTLRRELNEEVGLREFELGPELWTREHTFAWMGRILRQRDRIYLVRVQQHEPAPTIDLRPEGVHELRWWTLPELEATKETLVPRRLVEVLRELIEHGAPAKPIDVGI